MNQISKLARSSPLITGSFLMIVGSNIANVIAYFYHFVLGRMLGTVLYGELVAFLSIVGFLSSLYSFIGLIITKYAAKEKDNQKSLSFFLSIYQYFKRPAIAVSLIILLLTPFASKALQLPTLVYMMISPAFLLSFVFFQYRSYIQGRLSFGKVSTYSIAEMTLRFLIGLILVYLGFGSTGAVIGFLVSILVLFTVLTRDKVFREKGTKESIVVARLIREGIPVFVTTLATTAIFSTDVILVRAFFEAGDAGTYAAVSTLGKTILFSTVPITAVLFPLISRKHSEGKSDALLFLLSFAMTFCVGGAFALIFYFFPELAITTLFGHAFVEASRYMFPFSVFLLLLVLCLVEVNYYLPKEKYYPTLSLAVAAIAQVIGIFLFHESLISVINVSTVVMLALFANLLLYFAYENHSLKRFVRQALRNNSSI